MMNISGTWVFTQKWNDAEPYKFTAKFSNNRIDVDGKYYGTWNILGNSSYLAIALTSTGGKSITAYVGNVLGSAMGGEMTGVATSGEPVFGTWSAQSDTEHSAPLKTLADPGK